MLYLAQANSRMKDFYDIYMLATTYDFDGGTFFEAVKQTTERRATPMEEHPIVLDLSFALMKDKNVQWSAFCKRIHKDDLKFADVLAVIRRLLSPIHQALIHENEHLGYWNHLLHQWE